MSQFQGIAFVYSGRVDPSWPVEETLAQGLVAIWNELEPLIGEKPSAAPLGYRGCSLKGFEGQEFVSYGGAVTLVTEDTTEVRADVGRRFERLLLSTAPADALPDDLVIE